MALTTRPSRANDPLAALLTSEPLVLDTPAARRALQAGVLEAKRAALRDAARLVALGRPLLVAVIAVSFTHALHVVAAIRPPDVAPLTLPGWIYHVTAAALTLAIDAAALFAVAAAGATALVGQTRRLSAGLLFFLTTTFLLNAAFVLTYAPSLPAWVRTTVLPTLQLLFAALIPAIIPVALFVIERAQGRLRAARLKLVVEITAMEELSQGAGRKPQNAAGRNLGLSEDAAEPPDAPASSDRTTGGRTPTFTLDDLTRVAGADGTVRRAALIDTLGCSTTTADRLLLEGQERGLLTRDGRGVYRLRGAG